MQVHYYKERTASLVLDEVQRQFQPEHEREEYLPSVMDCQSRYRGTTDAVSSKVATKEPSTFELEPCKEMKNQQIDNQSKSPSHLADHSTQQEPSKLGEYE